MSEMKTKEQMLQLSDDELIEYYNSLVDENERTTDQDIHNRKEKQKELFREVWIEKHGFNKEQVIEIRRPRYI